ncbi:MAG: hypothetical protein ACREJS_16680 [Candidatus Rokuibacteriota bacterium]
MPLLGSGLCRCGCGRRANDGTRHARFWSVVERACERARVELPPEIFTPDDDDPPRAADAEA